MTEIKPEERIQLQLERLQSTMNRAIKNVPFHRSRLTQPNGEPVFVERREEIGVLPFMRRKDFEEHYPYGLFAVPLRDIVRIHTAPGMFHHPTVSGYTKQDLQIWRRIVAKALTAAGVTSHDIVQISFNSGLANWGRDYKDGSEEAEASVIPNTQLSIENHTMIMRDYKTSVLITTPTMAMSIAKHIYQAGINISELNLRTMILAGEPLEASRRNWLEETLNIKTWLQYGLSEVPGPSIAFECEAHHGLHVNEEHFLPEIIDPETGSFAGPDDIGELVLTSLTVRAFPLIRFRTGDRVRFIETRCDCGRSSRRIEWQPQRADELLVIGGVKVSLRRVDSLLEQLLGCLPLSRRFLGQNANDYLEVWIEMNPLIFSDEIKMLEKIVEGTAAKLQETMGVPVIVRLKEKTSFNRLPPNGMNLT